MDCCTLVNTFIPSLDVEGRDIIGDAVLIVIMDIGEKRELDCAFVCYSWFGMQWQYHSWADAPLFSLG